MNKPFRYLGQYDHSSRIPTIESDGAPMRRSAFWDRLVAEHSGRICAHPDASYYATGGGYGSNDQLIAHMKQSRAMDAAIPSIKGADFRHHPAFEAEKISVRAAIRRSMAPDAPDSVPDDAVEPILSAFYSDEVNTKLAKEVVNRALDQGKSVIHESASIYPDAIERVQRAKKAGLKTVLVAGTRDLQAAIAAKPDVEPANTATSYQKFAARFHEELLPLFDEVRLYNTDAAPLLIAHKSAAGMPLVVHDPARHHDFMAQAKINPQHFASAHHARNAIALQHADVARGSGTYNPIQPTHRGNAR